MSGDMRYITLGRTGLKVSKVGLGCGGHARIGQAYDLPEDHSIAIVRRAVELGINFIDTATAYNTETIVGKAIRDIDRSGLVIATKNGVHDWREDRLRSPDEFAEGIDESLHRLGTDYVDLYLIHGIRPDHYAYARDHILPVLHKAIEQGKVRHASVSEVWIHDPGHEMLQLALPDDVFDVVMVGFNLLNPSARQRVFPLTRRQNVGTLNMFSVRAALSKPDKLRELMRTLMDEGRLRDGEIDADHALDFLTAPGIARSLPEAAYRYVAHEPGVDVVLTGTGSVEHLEENVRSILADPLPADAHDRLGALFGHLDHVTGN